MTIRILEGDCRAMLRDLPAESVHCVVTSPPYWGLRDYGTATWEGGDTACEHIEGPARQDQERETPGGRGGSFRGGNKLFKYKCPCGATRIDAQIGLEPSPAAYVDELVAVFREVRRVLRNDGTLWLNLGDSYNGYMANQRATSISANNQHARPFFESGWGRRTDSLKAKDLIGIPWRVAFALQADGWWLRQDIIWSKPNPMPESVTDRCTKAHEYIFLLSKSERYYYDADAIAENATARLQQRQTLPTEHPKAAFYGGQNFVDGGISTTRNKRSVWEVATQPYSEAHFATFPPALIEPCILAGCPAGGSVLDPFGGAGTTGLVADRLQRNAILVELNGAYASMARGRIQDDAPLFIEVGA